jgi:subtilisin family serine protease
MLQKMLGLSLIVSLLVTVLPAAAANSQAVGRVPDRVVITLRPDLHPTVTKSTRGVSVDLPGLNALAQRYAVRDMAPLYAGAGVPTKHGEPDLRLVWAVDFSAAFDLDTVLNDYAALPEVALAEAVEIFPLYDLPDDPFLSSQQYHLRNSIMGGASVRALGGWAETQGDTNVVIAIVDSGVDWQHPDLGGTGPDYIDGDIWINWAEWNGTNGVDDDSNGFIDDYRGWDFVTGITDGEPGQDVDVPDNDPMDFEGHGTECAGCAGAMTNNGTGVASVGYSTRIMPLRVGWLQAGQTIGVVRMDFASQGMIYAANNGAKIVNCSWGSSNFLSSAVNFCVSRGVIIVTAAGNSDNEVASYLGEHAEVIAVAATDANDVKASFSSYGTWVEVSAPGINIMTTSWNRATSQHIYHSVDGTSFSAPIVGGALALIWAANPGWTRVQVMNQLLNTADDLDALNPTYAGKLGSGRPNLLRALGDHFLEVPTEYEEIFDALNEASVGDTIGVLASTALTGNQTIPSKELKVFGGYDPGFATRDPAGNPTVITALPNQTALQFEAGISSTTEVDGFSCQGGGGTLFANVPFSGRYGGGVIVNQCSPILRNLDVTGCSVGSASELGCGGGMFLHDSSSYLENVNVHDNMGIYGAGVFIYKGAPTLVNCTIADNDNLTDNLSHPPLGGGLHILDADVTMRDCEVNGHAEADEGGGIYAANHLASTVLDLQDSYIHENYARTQGAGICMLGDSITMKRDTLYSNIGHWDATYVDGGAFYIENAAVDIDSLVCFDNGAQAGAGGTITNVPSADLTNSLFHSNNAAFFAAGLYYGDVATGTLAGNTIALNSAVTGGGGLYLVNADPTVSNNLIAWNHGGASAANGVYGINSTPDFQCNDVYGNTEADFGGVTDPTGSDGNISLDPLFCSTSPDIDDDWTLHLDSPCTADSSGCGLIGYADVGCDATPVFLVLFTAEPRGGVVYISWRIGAGSDPASFRLEAQVGEDTWEVPHTVDNSGLFTAADRSPLLVGREQASYSLYYHLGGDDWQLLQTQSVALDMQPLVTGLTETHPNPFNPQLSISFAVAKPQPIKVTVYDMAGRVVRVLTQESYPVGTHTLVWDGTDGQGRAVSSGTYLLQLAGGAVHDARKIMLIR